MFHSTLSLDGTVFHWIEEKSLKSTQGPIFLVNARKAPVRWNLRGHLFSLSTHHSSRKAVIQLLDRESMLPTHRNRMSACATPSPQWLLLNRISVHLIFTRQYIPSCHIPGVWILGKRTYCLSSWQNIAWTKRDTRIKSRTKHNKTLTHETKV